jgi:hypothetical protein
VLPARLARRIGLSSLLSSHAACRASDDHDAPARTNALPNNASRDNDAHHSVPQLTMFEQGFSGYLPLF